MDDQKKSVFQRILKETSRLPARVTYHTAWLGAVILATGNIDPGTLHPALATLFGGIGINVLSNMIERMATGDEELSSDEILATVQYALGQAKLDEILSQDKLKAELAQVTGGITVFVSDAIDAGNREIASLLLDQTNLLITEMQVNYTKLANQMSSEFAALHRRFDKIAVSTAPISSRETTGTPRRIRVFLSSPGDVGEERAIALKVLDKIAHDPLLKDKVIIEAVAWDKKGDRVPMLANMTPQQAVNLGMPTPSQCDIVVVIFWSRMGTPLPEEFKKSDGSRYWSGTEWEYHNALEAYEDSGIAPKIIVYRRTEEPTISLGDKDLTKKITQYERVKTFFDAFTNDDESISRGYNSYEKPSNFEQDLESDLKSLMARILEEEKPPASTVETPSEVSVQVSDGREVWQGSPFPGLRAFQPEDEPIFFGRSNEIDELMQVVQASRFAAVVGASGSGKSSLVGAGLIPRLQKDALETSGDWQIVRFKPGAEKDKDGVVNPFVALFDGLAETFTELKSADWLEQEERRSKYATQLASNSMSLASLCKHVSPDHDVLFFVDQFEETFTLVSDVYRPLFVNMLVHIAESQQLRVIVTMRSDFTHRCLEYPKLSKLLNGGQYNLSAPGLASLYEMIVRPAERANLQFEAGLPGQILEDTGYERGALALMAYALDELYEITVDKHGDRRLTFKAYRSLEGVQGAIGVQAEKTFEALNGDEAEKLDLLQTIFRELVEVDDNGTATRHRSSISSLATTELASELIETFTDARLLVTSATGDSEVVEVAHEALFRSWGRLRDWIAEAQEDLILLRQIRTAAAEWHRNSRPEYLRWNHERLLPVYAMIERLKLDMSDVLEAFIEPEQVRLYRELGYDVTLYDDLSVDVTPSETMPETSHERRRDIGERLAVIGDTRKGIGVVDGVPEIEWVPVTGSRGQKFKFYGDEGIYGEFEVPDFYISKYLVTYTQYQVFVDTYYQESDWWRGFPQAYQPQEIRLPRTTISNAPRDTISWYQAVAYGRWVDVQLHNRQILPNNALQVRIPTESEWQWVAMHGAEQRPYPWGEWYSGYANTIESGLTRSIAVGMYPQGKSMNGTLDMCGELREWCLNNYDNPNTFGGSGQQARKILHGGAFTAESAICSNQYRTISLANLDRNSNGLRLVLSVPISVSEYFEFSYTKTRES